MALVTSGHFGGNIILTNDSAKAGAPFREMLSEISFSNFRYPGGGVTEDQTWANGGLQKMFGPPMTPGEPGYVMTLREALELCEDQGSSISIVVPTFQFYNVDTKIFDSRGFSKYIGEVEKALTEHPDVNVSSFEIGNEYWAEITASQYGIIANHQIPALDALNDRLSAKIDDWDDAQIGIQAGVAWKPSGVEESAQIANQISMGNRELVDVIYQHAYPNPHRGLEWQMEWAMKPVDAMKMIDGFRDDVNVSLSEFNIGIHPGAAAVYGVNQGAMWIEEFSRHIDAGVDAMDHWGLNYNWLTTKFYDSKFAPTESNGGEIVTIATPMGQVYDLASSHLVGKYTMDDKAAVADINITGHVGITGFEEDDQRVVFFSNTSGKDAEIDFSKLTSDYHVVAHHIVPADSPASSWYDESTSVLGAPDQVIDARGDMKVVSSDAVDGSFFLGQSELLMLLISDKDRDLTLEGAHNVTDPQTGMVNDHISGGAGDDILRGHVGDDTLNGGAGNDVLIGGRGDDVLNGGTGDDFLISDQGADTLFGGDGDDILLIGGKKSDDTVVASGGKGHDLILWDGGRDVTLNDFQDGDQIGFGGAFSDKDELMSALETDGKNLVINFPEGKKLVMTDAADFAEDFADRVFDFAPNDIVAATLEDFRTRFNNEQHDEAFSDFREFAQSPHHDPTLWQDYVWDVEAEEPVDPVDVEPQHPEPEPEPDDGDDDDDKEEEDDDDPLQPPIPPTDEEVPDDDEQDYETASGGGCFVATAAYGNPKHPDVIALRAFRDRHLVKFAVGRLFVRVYWVVGPRLAKITKPASLHGKLARANLRALVMILARFGLTGR